MARPRTFQFTPDGFFGHTTVTECGCWEWKGAKTPVGYGVVNMGLGYTAYLATRLAWSMASAEPIPDGLWVLHRCDNPPCINPAHLFLGTPSDNSSDRERKGRGGRLTHCRNGHEYTPENTSIRIVKGKQIRNCRTCLTRTREVA